MKGPDILQPFQAKVGQGLLQSWYTVLSVRETQHEQLSGFRLYERKGHSQLLYRTQLPKSDPTCGLFLRRNFASGFYDKTACLWHRTGNAFVLSNKCHNAQLHFVSVGLSRRYRRGYPQKVQHAKGIAYKRYSIQKRIANNRHEQSPIEAPTFRRQANSHSCGTISAVEKGLNKVFLALTAVSTKRMLHFGVRFLCNNCQKSTMDLSSSTFPSLSSHLVKRSSHSAKRLDNAHTFRFSSKHSKFSTPTPRARAIIHPMRPKLPKGYHLIFSKASRLKSSMSPHPKNDFQKKKKKV